MKNVLYLSVAVFFLISCQSRPVSSPEKRGEIEVISGIPSGAVKLDHRYFVISYDPVERLPNWVLYRLQASQLAQKNAKRRDSFFADPLLIAQGLPAVGKDDYETRRFDRGHMAPAEDFSWAQEASDATFVMTNMAPQVRTLNRGSWKALEAKVRRWACAEGELRIITGPIRERNLEKMRSGVGIPKQFFKVVVDETPPRKAIAFIYSQNDVKVSYKERSTTMKAVEVLTGYKFFNDLPERDLIAAKFNLDEWTERDCRDSAQPLGTTQMDAKNKKK